MICECMSALSHFEIGLIALGIDIVLAIIFRKTLWEKFKKLVEKRDD